MSTCDRVTEFALRTMPAGDRAAFALHVEDCATCRGELEALRVVVDAFVEWPTDVLRPPAPLWDRLAARIGAPPSATVESRWETEPPWKDVAPGIACKLLSTDEPRGMVSMLVRLDANSEYPPHTHAGIEELFLLDGELWIDNRKLLPGDYNRGEPGTDDARVWSETGCTCVLVTSLHDVLLA